MKRFIASMLKYIIIIIITHTIHHSHFHYIVIEIIVILIVCLLTNFCISIFHVTSLVTTVWIAALHGVSSLQKYTAKNRRAITHAYTN